MEDYLEESGGSLRRCEGSNCFLAEIPTNFLKECSRTLCLIEKNLNLCYDTSI